MGLISRGDVAVGVETTMMVVLGKEVDVPHEYD